MATRSRTTTDPPPRIPRADPSARPSQRPSQRSSGRWKRRSVGRPRCSGRAIFLWRRKVVARCHGVPLPVYPFAARSHGKWAGAMLEDDPQGRGRGSPPQRVFRTDRGRGRPRGSCVALPPSFGRRRATDTRTSRSVPWSILASSRSDRASNVPREKVAPSRSSALPSFVRRPAPAHDNRARGVVDSSRRVASGTRIPSFRRTGDLKKKKPPQLQLFPRRPAPNLHGPLGCPRALQIASDFCSDAS